MWFLLLRLYLRACPRDPTNVIHRITHSIQLWHSISFDTPSSHVNYNYRNILVSICRCNYYYHTNH